MDKTEAVRIANDYINKISSKYLVTSALLFGSYARGTNREDSDIDIAIVAKNIRDIIDVQYDLMKLKRGIDLRIEPHPFKEKDFVTANPIVNEILTYGIRLR